MGIYRPSNQNQLDLIIKITKSFNVPIHVDYTLDTYIKNYIDEFPYILDNGYNGEFCLAKKSHTPNIHPNFRSFLKKYLKFCKGFKK